MTIILLTDVLRRVVILKKYYSTFFALFCLFALTFCMSVSCLGNMSATLYSSVLRLHVVANSDSEKDQQIKLMVRDGMLNKTRELFLKCESVDEAVAIAKSNRKVLEDTARCVLRDNGICDDVEIVIGKETYPEKKYASLTFPEGEYLSVRVLIGEGKGRNWWCVLFPPLCNYSGTDEGKVLESYGINSDCVKRLQEETEGKGIEIFGCNVRLKFLELFD